MTAQRFSQIIVSDDVVRRIRDYRERQPERNELKAQIENVRTLIEANPDPKHPMNKELKRQLRELSGRLTAIDSLKRGLPTLMYQCRTFDETTSKRGYRGRWRKQAAARLNGLFMLDVDHVEDPRGEVTRWVARHCLGDGADPAGFQPTPEQRKEFAAHHQILLIHVTPSGRGLRIVAKASTATGNLADNQLALAQRLGVEPDAACKDATRCSFCPGFEDILYIDKNELFTYENPEFDETFGPYYRGGDSRPVAAHAKSLAGNNSVDCLSAGMVAGNSGGADSTGAEVVPPKVGIPDGLGATDRRITEGYHGVKYETIIDKWYDVISKGRPMAGDRHRVLLQMAGDLRYITDNNPKLLARVLMLSDTGVQLRDEGAEDEIKRIADSACARQLWATIPKRLLPVLEAAGVQLPDSTANVQTRTGSPIDYAAWWHRLEPLLPKCRPLEAAVAPLPDAHKLAGVLAAGAMMGTYLTRTWWEHFDGKDYRLSFLVYIVGDAASGKSFVTELDRLVMAPMLAADRVGREWERQYKEEMKKRAASTKNAKQEAPEQQHPVIRYVPSTVSNAMLYRRLTDAVDNNAMGPDEQPIHLHCYTMEPELATALRAQQGSWAGKNDLELKSFHNEFAGVDYANDQSVNGIIQVNWNQVVTGTWESMARKIRPAMVLDGLVTRLVLFPMPSNEFQMIDRRAAIRDHEREALLRSVGITLETIRGQLKAGRLVDFCYDYERQLTQEARLEQDECLDYFRKRIPVIMMRYGLVWLVLRHTDEARKGAELPVDDDDLQFVKLIGDWCLAAQMRLFGQMVIEARQREREQFVPRRRTTKVREAYARLPEEFRPELLVSEGIARDAASATVMVSRWRQDGLVEKNGKAWRKKFGEIPV